MANDKQTIIAMLDIHYRTIEDLNSKIVNKVYVSRDETSYLIIVLDKIQAGWAAFDEWAEKLDSLGGEWTEEGYRKRNNTSVLF